MEEELVLQRDPPRLAFSTRPDRAILIVRPPRRRDHEAWRQFGRFVPPRGATGFPGRGLQDGADIRLLDARTCGERPPARPRLNYDPSRGSFRGYVLYPIARTRSSTSSSRRIGLGRTATRSFRGSWGAARAGSPRLAAFVDQSNDAPSPPVAQCGACGEYSRRPVRRDCQTSVGAIAREAAESVGNERLRGLRPARSRCSRRLKE